MIRIISYVEPVPGLNIDGQEVTCVRKVEMTAPDVCNHMRHILTRKAVTDITKNLTNNDLIQEFVTIYWADIIEREEKNDLSNR